MIIGALAVFLIATILQLFKINAGLSVVLPLVGQIVAKTGPVNPVVDDINRNLVITRDALENLMLKKAGPDSAGLVESLFPGEGAKFLKRVGRAGRVVNVGTVYTRGVGILASLGRGAPIGAAHAKGAAVRDPQYSTTEVAKLYPAPPGRRDPTQNIPKSPTIGKDPVHSPYEPARPRARVRVTLRARRSTAHRRRLRLRRGSGGQRRSAGGGGGSAGIRAEASPPWSPLGQGPAALGALNTEKESGSGRTLFSGRRVL